MPAISVLDLVCSCFFPFGTFFFCLDFHFSFGDGCSVFSVVSSPESLLGQETSSVIRSMPLNVTRLVTLLPR